MRVRRTPFFFPDIDKMVEEMEKEMADIMKNMDKIVPRDMVREFQLPNGTVRREYGPFVYGYSMKIGPDGKPIITEFGNMKPAFEREGRPPLDLQDQREPLVDIVDEGDTIRIIAELPGVEKNDIKLYATSKSLTISVDTPQRKYYKELELPSEVDESSARSTYKNGILETILKKRQKTTGRKIDIE
ncbi:Hsp20/alpha crystallin family protein [Candidatus Bathyarchaeota archaeon]|nr:Hsp20/alpha crystallin family protein [Candidatus Bathyarchaeota archaeon]MBS7630858.1 Hsp20/alpha crystallin family protein [Candidatus Bathyarchaeota archaeon]